MVLVVVAQTVRSLYRWIVRNRQKDNQQQFSVITPRSKIDRDRIAVTPQGDQQKKKKLEPQQHVFVKTAHLKIVAVK